MLIIMGRHKSFILNSKISGKLLVWRVYISKELPKFSFTSTLKKNLQKPSSYQNIQPKMIQKIAPHISTQTENIYLKKKFKKF